MLKKEWERYKIEIKNAMEDLKTKGRRKKQIPNILTSLRLLAPFFILPASFFGNIPLVLGLVAGFSATDMLDGFIARTFHLTSQLGKDLDAVCDKLFSLTLLLASSIMNPIMLVTLALESSIAVINVNAKLKGKETHSLYIGKAKTIFLFPLLGLSLVSNVEVFDFAFKTVFGITTGLQALTAASYFTKYQLEEKNSSANFSNNIKQIEIIETEEQPRSKKKEKVLNSDKRTQKISMLKDLKTLLLKETALPEKEKGKENIKK